jgi:hypothetical protein
MEHCVLLTAIFVSRWTLIKMFRASCLVLDLDEDEANKLMTVLDPLAAMADSNNEALKSLLEEIQTDDDAVQAMLDGLAKENGITLDGCGSGGLTDPDEIPAPPAVPVTKPGDLWLLGPFWQCENCGKVYDYEVGKTMEECPCG